MQERGTTSNSELVLRTPGFVGEIFENDRTLIGGYEFITNTDYGNFVDEAFSEANKPYSDIDRDGWVNLLRTSYLGYKIQQRLWTGKNITEDDFVSLVQEQLTNDEHRWGDTWKKRTIEGQLDRTYFDFNNYKDKDRNGNEPLPWLKVAGNVIICLTRLDNPDYQKLNS